MKVLFIYPDICTFSGGFLQGIGFISSLLKRNGHDTSLMHITHDIKKDILIKKLDREKPDIIAFSITTNQFKYACKFAGWVKEVKNTTIIAGGIHPTLDPDSVLCENHFDIVCVGEGEYAILELVNLLEKNDDVSNIPNIYLKKDGKIIRNKLRPLIQDLDSIPFPDRELFDHKTMLHKNGGLVDIMAGRGCPYSCTYCCNHSLKEIYHHKGRYMRIRSPENIIQEIKTLLHAYDINKINFNDDTFTLFPDWVSDFCDKYSREIKIPFLCNVRPETVTRKVLEDLKKAGCEQIRIGVESGSEWIRKNVMNRRMTNEQIINVFKIAKQIGIKTYSFNMVGLPYETPAMAEETINLNKLIQPDYIQISIFYPYPGTELYKLCLEKGMLIEKSKDSYFDDGIMISSPYFNEKELKKYYEKFKNMAFDIYISNYYPSVTPYYSFLKSLIGYRMTETLFKSGKKIITNSLGIKL